MNTDERAQAAITRVAVAAFQENLGEEALMSLNVNGLDAFRVRNGISQDDMNIAWSELQRRFVESSTPVPLTWTPEWSGRGDC